MFWSKAATMEYTREILDRATGRLVEVSIGDWITVTEFGLRHGVGEKKVRAVLHHIGLLVPEKGRYRLPMSAVEKGLGIRHDRPKHSKHPFDVLSPYCQQLIEQVWADSLADYETDQRGDAQIVEAKEALDNFRGRRLRKMTTQEEICWVLDHFPRLSYQQVASVVEVDRALVSRYAKRRASDRAYRERLKQCTPCDPGLSRSPLRDEGRMWQSDDVSDEEAIFRRLAI